MSYTNNNRVVKGEGILHSHKVQYSKETHQLIKVLLEESKLTILQRQQVQNSLRNGEPLPPLSLGKNIKSSVQGKKSPSVKFQIFHKKRTHDDIVRSGAYEREPFVSIHPKVDKEKEKQKFQSLMAYGKVIPPTPIHKSRLPPRAQLHTPLERDRFAELIEEINERLHFVMEMKELGCEKNYQSMIEQQIAAKLREMKKIDPQRCLEFQRHKNLVITQPKQLTLNMN
ncbi:hypothetical protein L9F63_006251 [Diploptera punctata]|uniref:Uncharacterized protein n=1 Tax=Diploptera punctata TaxID=6984 RepID=A0AAD7ZAZ8_DIPPU|nr:hypothetical protein L9F63_006251 [Diploptera punctata]